MTLDSEAILYSVLLKQDFSTIERLNRTRNPMEKVRPRAETEGLLTKENAIMATKIVMKVQVRNATNGDVFYAHLNPSTGRLDSWGFLINELPDFEEGGDE
nr:MAG TPA: hypothetical protein [Caudoviricetes sp.]